MGNFANTLFSVLLGWVQSAAAWIWSLVGSESGGGFGAWVLDHWLLLVILLCVAGVVVDWVVYLIRWQPYRVWRSFIRRIKGIADDEAVDEQETWQWVNADGSTAQDPMLYPEVQADGMQLEAPVRPARRVIPARRHGAAEGETTYEGVPKAYHQPYYPPQWHTVEQQTTDGGDVT